MRLIPNSSAYTTKQNTVSNCGAISTCHIWTPKYTIEYMHSSKSIGLSLMIMVYLFQSKTTYMLLTLAMPHPSTSRKFSLGPRRHPSCGVPLLPLKKVGQIRQNTDGCWSFKALLAANLYQEHIQNIDKFVWHFCINYIPLSSVTRIIAYLILHCDLAKNEEFGLGVLYWLFDSLIGCHQLAVALASQVKVAFQCHDAIKWTYTVMPFGP